LSIFDEIERMRKEFDKYFDQMYKNISSGLKETAVDIISEDNHLVIKIDMPGVSKEDIDLIVNKDSISVKAERKEAKEEKEKGYYSKERTYKGYSIYRTLPVEVLPDTAEAEYKDGVLTIKVEKAVKEKEKEGKKVSVK